MEELSLSKPDWIICDVGTSVYHFKEGAFRLYTPYSQHLDEKVGKQNRDAVEALLTPLENLALQCDAHQGKYKISFECETNQTESLVHSAEVLLKQEHLPYDVHGSVDPFLDCGLIDVLPKGVSKAYAVTWLASHADFQPDAVIYAGDSGNDLSALTAGFRAILVANHSQGLDTQIRERLGDAAETLVYASKGTATSGVLEGCRHFGLIT
jgi:HAD superfamily hydrolase (TIGR01484 family)